MIHKIRSRLQAVENAKKGVGVPDLVIIFWDKSKNQWIAQEQYVKKTSKGKVIPSTGRNRFIPLVDPDQYRPPEGFKGSIIHERELE